MSLIPERLPLALWRKTLRSKLCYNAIRSDLRFARHLQFFRRNGLKDFARANRDRRVLARGQDQSNCKAGNENYSTKWHVPLPGRWV